VASQASSDISCLVKANLLLLVTVPAVLQASTATCREAVSLKYQTGGKDSCSSLHSLPHRAVICDSSIICETSIPHNVKLKME